jgi:hypothetical protein
MAGYGASLSRFIQSMQPTMLGAAAQKISHVAAATDFGNVWQEAAKSQSVEPTCEPNHPPAFH